VCETHFPFTNPLSYADDTQSRIRSPLPDTILTNIRIKNTRYRNGGPMFGLVNCRFSRCKFLCFWRCERERRPMLQ